MTASNSKQKPHILYRVLMSLIVGVIGLLGLLESICHYLADPSLPKTAGIRILINDIKPFIITYVTAREHFLNHLYFYLFLLAIVLIASFFGIKKATQSCYDFLKKRSFGEKAKKAEDEIDFVEYSLIPLLIKKMEHCLKRTMNKNE